MVENTLLQFSVSRLEAGSKEEKKAVSKQEWKTFLSKGESDMIRWSWWDSVDRLLIKMSPVEAVMLWHYESCPRIASPLLKSWSQLLLSFFQKEQQEMQNSSINANSQCRIESREIHRFDGFCFVYLFIFLNGLIMCRKLFCLGGKSIRGLHHPALVERVRNARKRGARGGTTEMRLSLVQPEKDTGPQGDMVVLQWHF